MTLAINQLSKSFGSQCILQQAQLAPVSGSLITLIGPSGAGKSTLIRMIAGLDEQFCGQICINNVQLPMVDTATSQQYRRQNAVVFQYHNLLPHLNVLDNIIFPLKHIVGMPRSQSIDKAMHLLERFQLTTHSKKYPHQLSGGQSQRIALCRAMVVEPRILFLDEPTASLDPEMTYEVLQMISELQKDHTDIMMVTHNIRFALKSSSHFLFVAQQKITYHSHDDIQSPPPGSTLHHFLEYALL